MDLTETLKLLRYAPENRNGSEENGTIRSECEEDEGTDCEDGDSDTD